jgi:hypothetical protein
MSAEAWGPTSSPHADFWRLRDVLSTDAGAAYFKGFLRERAALTAAVMYSRPDALIRDRRDA